MTNDLMKIANHYGYEPQTRQTIEELNELAVAISHYLRKDDADNLENVLEEIADVQIMLEQYIYLLEQKKGLRWLNSGITSIKHKKINRQIERVKADE